MTTYRGRREAKAERLREWPAHIHPALSTARLAVGCLTCGETTTYPYETIKDAQEYDRFLGDCVRSFAAEECTCPGYVA